MSCRPLLTCGLELRSVCVSCLASGERCAELRPDVALLLCLMLPTYRQCWRSLSVKGAERGADVQSFGKMGLGPRGGMPARPWGQRIGSNDKHNEWKLFIGQVPLEVGFIGTALPQCACQAPSTRAVACQSMWRF